MRTKTSNAIITTSEQLIEETNSEANSIGIDVHESQPERMTITTKRKRSRRSDTGMYVLKKECPFMCVAAFNATISQLCVSCLITNSNGLSNPNSISQRTNLLESPKHVISRLLFKRLCEMKNKLALENVCRHKNHIRRAQYSIPKVYEILEYFVSLSVQLCS